MRIALIVALALFSVTSTVGAQEGAYPGAGTDKDYTPLLTFTPGGTLLQFRLRVASTVEHATAFAADADGAQFEAPWATDLVVRAGARFASGKSIEHVSFGLDFELDAFTGTINGAPELQGAALPYDRGFDHLIRKAFVRFSWQRYLHVMAGYMMSHWGMGLVANDGDHGWTPGSAAFTDPRRGDNVLRFMLASGPLEEAAGLQLAVSYDFPQYDDSILKGDTSGQVVGAVRIGVGSPYTAGVYAAWRQQENKEGRGLDVVALDATAAAKFELGTGLSMTVEAEGVVILGETTLAPNNDFDTHEVLQVGAAARVAVDAGWIGGVADFIYASGDQNLDDDTQHGFKTDSNYHMGMLLFRQVLAAQSGRGSHTAGDPTLVGQPALDLDRFPTRGSISNTIAVFPRVWVRPI